MIGNPLLLGPEGYQISRSVRLRSSASAYFNRTPASASNRKTWTWSGWVKRGSLGNFQVLFGSWSSGSDTTGLLFGSNNTLFWDSYSGGLLQGTQVTAAVYRDTSAWYHIVLAIDTTQATAANRARLYVNGAEVVYATNTAPAQNSDLMVNRASAHTIGNTSVSAGNYFDGYLTEINFIDGQALTPSSFGETDAITGVWKPKKYAGTYGTNGFFLNFSDNSSNTATTIGKDYSGNGNNWTPNNISVTAGSTYDSMLDVPTLWADGGNGRGNYCTLNPLNPSSGTVSDGNLRQLHSAASYQTAISTIAMPSGKWYCEITCTAIGGTGDGVIGVSRSPVGATFTGNTADSYGWYSKGSKYNNGSSTAYASGAQWTTGDVIGIAFDNTAGSFEFYKNGTALGVAFSGLTIADYYFAVSSYSNTTFAVNFGQRPFAYTPPTGFKALNTQNLPEPTIKKGGSYFDIATWSGDNAVSRTITGAAFDPDLIWVKQRNGGGVHLLFDTVRSGGYNLQSQSTAAESTYGSLSAGGIASSATGGFTVAKGSVDSNYVNGTGGTYVGWQWKEGATQGFDIVTYTGNGTAGRTISHSLGVTPAMTIVKDRSNGTNGWPVWHRAYAGTQTLYLESTTGLLTRDRVTAVSSTTFTVGSHTEVNNNGNTYVAYLFSEVAGFSKFGSYTGNGSSDGPFVFCGFRPRWVMVKKTSATDDWVVFDTARDTFNVVNDWLFPNLSNAELTTAGSPDVLSNGFKFRSTSGATNASGASFIFAAFAESPFKLSLAR